jgi:zinc transport system permease protein
MDELFINALITSVGLSLLLAPMGCFVVWRNMSFFGETLSHSALLGIGGALVLGLPIFLGVLLIVGALALMLGQGAKPRKASHTHMAIIMYTCLSLGLMLMHFFPTHLSAESFLFGDLLLQSTSQQLILFACALGCLGFLFVCYKPLLLMTLSAPLAKAEGVNITALNRSFIFILAAAISVAVQSVGVLLVPAMLILPAAIAFIFSRSPSHMIGLSVMISGFAYAGGLSIAFYANTPTAPTVIAVAAGLYALAQFLRRGA